MDGIKAETGAKAIKALETGGDFGRESKRAVQELKAVAGAEGIYLKPSVSRKVDVFKDSFVKTEKAVKGGSDSGNYVYRALNQKDYERYTKGLGLEAKNPNGNWSLKEHLVDGLGKLSWANDPYISTTSDLSVAKGFNQSGSGYGIVKIDLNKVNSPSYKGYEINLVGMAKKVYHIISQFGNRRFMYIKAYHLK